MAMPEETYPDEDPDNPIHYELTQKAYDYLDRMDLENERQNT